MGRDKLSLSRAEVIEDGDLIFHQQGLYEMAADETGTPGNED